MVRWTVLGMGLGLAGLGIAQDVDLAALETRGCHPKGDCQPCNKDVPKGFTFAPCPVDARFSGSVALGGNVDYGRMNLSIGGKLTNACGNSQPCKRAKLNVERIMVEHLYFEKNQTTVDVSMPKMSHKCSVCDIILTYPIHDKPKPTPPKDQCKVPLDFIATVDVSKSMKTTKGTADGTIDLITAVSRRFKIGQNHTRFAVTTFNDNAHVEWPLKSDMAINRHKVQKGIKEIQFTNRFSNHGAGLDLAINQFRQPPKRDVPNVLVLFADGKPNKDLVRLHKALARLRCQPRTCFAIVGINVREHSEEDAFFRKLLGCHPSDPCEDLFNLIPSIPAQVTSTAEKLSKHLCKCAKSTPKVPRPEALTTFTVRIAGKTLPDFGTRDELNHSVDEMLYNAAEAAGVTPDRLTAIAIEDTSGNIISDDLVSNAQRSLGQGDSTAPATLVEVMFEEPGLNTEIGSLDGARQLAAIMSQPESSFKDRCAARGLSELRVERIALRQNDGLMPIIDVLQE